MVENRPAEFVNFEAYPDYVLGPPGAAEVSIRSYGDLNAQVLGVEAGEIDFAYIRGASDDIIERLGSMEDFDLIPQAVGVNINFAMTQREYLQDKRIRQAFLYAIDRNAIAAVRGRGVAPATVINDWTMPSALAPDLNPYDFDPERARTLLEEAGWDSSRVVDAKWDGPPTGVDELPLMEQMWRDVGINVQLTRVDSANLINVLFEEMDYDIYVNISSGQLGGSPWAADLSMGCEMAYPNGYNGWGYCNPEWDAAYQEAVTALDPETRDAALQRASQIFNDELPYMPYFARLDQAAVSKRMSGPQQSQLLHYFAGGNPYWEWSISS
jgi:peptide/nickel transport system substrate-binding protein